MNFGNYKTILILRNPQTMNTQSKLYTKDGKTFFTSRAPFLPGHPFWGPHHAVVGKTRSNRCDSFLQQLHSSHKKYMHTPPPSSVLANKRHHHKSVTHSSQAKTLRVQSRDSKICVGWETHILRKIPWYPPTT